MNRLQGVWVYSAAVNRGVCASKKLSAQWKATCTYSAIPNTRKMLAGIYRTDNYYVLIEL